MYTKYFSIALTSCMLLSSALPLGAVTNDDKNMPPFVGKIIVHTSEGQNILPLQSPPVRINQVTKTIEFTAKPEDTRWIGRIEGTFAGIIIGAILGAIINRISK